MAARTMRRPALLRSAMSKSRRMKIYLLGFCLLPIVGMIGAVVIIIRDKTVRIVITMAVSGNNIRESPMFRSSHLWRDPYWVITATWLCELSFCRRITSNAVKRFWSLTSIPPSSVRIFNKFLIFPIFSSHIERYFSVEQ